MASVAYPGSYNLTLLLATRACLLGRGRLRDSAGNTDSERATAVSRPPSLHVFGWLIGFVMRRQPSLANAPIADREKSPPGTADPPASPPR
jgi:hypothetical protein